MFFSIFLSSPIFNRLSDSAKLIARVMWRVGPQVSGRSVPGSLDAVGAQHERGQLGLAGLLACRGGPLSPESHVRQNGRRLRDWLSLGSRGCHQPLLRQMPDEQQRQQPTGHHSGFAHLRSNGLADTRVLDTFWTKRFVSIDNQTDRIILERTSTLQSTNMN